MKCLVWANLNSLTNLYCFNIQEVLSRQKGDFPGNSLRVRKGVISCPICVSMNVTFLLGLEKIPIEYLSNRNLLMSKIVHFGSGQFGQF